MDIIHRKIKANQRKLCGDLTLLPKTTIPQGFFKINQGLLKVAIPYRVCPFLGREVFQLGESRLRHISDLLVGEHCPLALMESASVRPSHLVDFLVESVNAPGFRASRVAFSAITAYFSSQSQVGRVSFRRKGGGVSRFTAVRPWPPPCGRAGGRHRPGNACHAVGQCHCRHVAMPVLQQGSDPPTLPVRIIPTG